MCHKDCLKRDRCYSFDPRDHRFCVGDEKWWVDQGSGVFAHDESRDT